MDSQVTMRGNRLGAIEEMMARAAETSGKNGTAYLSHNCLEFLQAFNFPTFEILVTFQVALPVIYSFLVPCGVVFLVECCCRHRSPESMQSLRKKLSTVLISSWAHWYCHWEIWSMFWISLAITYLTECPLNARYYEFTVGMSVVSVTVCSISNILSDFRLNLAKGASRAIFNIFCFFLISWTLRIIYPCIFDIGTSEANIDVFNDFSTQDEDRSVTPPPPSYTEAQNNQPPPPSYQEAVARIKTQIPKLSRTISFSAQRLGRTMSLKRMSIVNIEQSVVGPENGQVAGSAGSSSRESSAVAAKYQATRGQSLQNYGSNNSRPSTIVVKQSISLVERGADAQE